MISKKITTWFKKCNWNIFRYFRGWCENTFRFRQTGTVKCFSLAKGTDINLAADEEAYLPHEAWHVVRQKQVPVRQTAQLKSNLIVNDYAI